ncbi:MAG: GYD domain-containing protein [Actinomycetota bacterium]|nr:GYD domain-containing protein [Actinomycetota bacterium]
MPKYLIKASYTPEGARGIAKEGGTSRRDTIAKLAQNTGGTMESFYFAFGEDDAYVVCDMPDNATAASVALAVNSSGAAQVTTVVLMTPEELDEATGKTVDYRPPGG